MDLKLTDIEEWLAEGDTDCGIHKEMSYEQIIAAVMQQPDEAVEEGDEPAAKISHSEAKQAFDVVLQYIEEHSSSMPTDILWIKKWRDLAARGQMPSLKQKSIIVFFLTKKISVIKVQVQVYKNKLNL